MKIDDMMDAMNDLPDDLILDSRPEARVQPRRRRILRTALIAAALAMLLSVTAYAAGGSLAGQRSSRRPGRSWASLEKLPKAEKLVGVGAAVPESFENGFAFERMDLLYTEVTNDAGAVTETYPQLDVRYARGGEKVMMEVMAERPQTHEERWTQTEIEGITVWSESFVYMAVPVDYWPTEAEQARVERGELMIGYGAGAVETISSSFAQFAIGGALYDLLSMDGLSESELVAMAGEIIRSANANE